MRRSIPITQIIAELQKLPDSAKIVVDTISTVRVVGLVLQRLDNPNKQIADIIVPKAEEPAKENIAVKKENSRRGCGDKPLR